MRLMGVKILFSICFVLTSTFSKSQSELNEDHNLVTMRLIGHHILLSAGDSISKVLPIEHVEDSYRISFENEFTFEPLALAAEIDSIMQAEQVSNHYFVTVEDCDSELVTYSYEYNSENPVAGFPCGGREYPLGCYEVVITNYEDESKNALVTDISEGKSGNSQTLYFILSIVGIGIVVLVFFISQRKKIEKESDVKIIGKFKFNKKKLFLSCDDELIELTSKEADLLEILYNSANDTLERETILNVVWEDQGVYVGRTLDVFISKLRKKLEADASIKILNIRGVGYKLVMDN